MQTLLCVTLPPGHKDAAVEVNTFSRRRVSTAIAGGDEVAVAAAAASGIDLSLPRFTHTESAIATAVGDEQLPLGTSRAMGSSKNNNNDLPQAENMLQNNSNNNDFASPLPLSSRGEGKVGGGLATKRDSNTSALSASDMMGMSGRRSSLKMLIVGENNEKLASELTQDDINKAWRRQFNSGPMIFRDGVAIPVDNDLIEMVTSDEEDDEDGNSSNSSSAASTNAFGNSVTSISSSVSTMVGGGQLKQKRRTKKSSTSKNRKERGRRRSSLSSGGSSAVSNTSNNSKALAAAQIAQLNPYIVDDEPRLAVDTTISDLGIYTDRVTSAGKKKRNYGSASSTASVGTGQPSPSSQLPFPRAMHHKRKFLEEVPEKIYYHQIMDAFTKQEMQARAVRAGDSRGATDGGGGGSAPIGGLPNPNSPNLSHNTTADRVVTIAAGASSASASSPHSPSPLPTPSRGQTHNRDASAPPQQQQQQQQPLKGIIATSKHKFLTLRGSANVTDVNNNATPQRSAVAGSSTSTTGDATISGTLLAENKMWVAATKEEAEAVAKAKLEERRRRLDTLRKDAKRRGWHGQRARTAVEEATITVETCAVPPAPPAVGTAPLISSGGQPTVTINHHLPLLGECPSPIGSRSQHQRALSAWVTGTSVIRHECPVDDVITPTAAVNENNVVEPKGGIQQQIQSSISPSPSSVFASSLNTARPSDQTDKAFRQKRQEGLLPSPSPHVVNVPSSPRQMNNCSSTSTYAGPTFSSSSFSSSAEPEETLYAALSSVVLDGLWESDTRTVLMHGANHLTHPSAVLLRRGGLLHKITADVLEEAATRHIDKHYRVEVILSAALIDNEEGIVYDLGPVCAVGGHKMKLVTKGDDEDGTGDSKNHPFSVGNANGEQQKKGTRNKTTTAASSAGEIEKRGRANQNHTSSSSPSLNSLSAVSNSANLSSSNTSLSTSNLLNEKTASAASTAVTKFLQTLRRAGNKGGGVREDLAEEGGTFPFRLPLNFSDTPNAGAVSQQHREEIIANVMTAAKEEISAAHQIELRAQAERDRKVLEAGIIPTRRAKKRGGTNNSSLLAAEKLRAQIEAMQREQLAKGNAATARLVSLNGSGSSAGQTRSGGAQVQNSANEESKVDALEGSTHSVSNNNHNPQITSEKILNGELDHELFDAQNATHSSTPAHAPTPVASNNLKVLATAAAPSAIIDIQAAGDKYIDSVTNRVARLRTTILRSELASAYDVENWLAFVEREWVAHTVSAEGSTPRPSLALAPGMSFSLGSTTPFFSSHHPSSSQPKSPQSPPPAASRPKKHNADPRRSALQVQLQIIKHSSAQSSSGPQLSTVRFITIEDNYESVKNILDAVHSKQLPRSCGELAHAVWRLMPSCPNKQDIPRKLVYVQSTELRDLLQCLPLMAAAKASTVVAHLDGATPDVIAAADEFLEQKAIQERTNHELKRKIESAEIKIKQMSRKIVSNEHAIAKLHQSVRHGGGGGGRGGAAHDGGGGGSSSPSPSVAEWGDAALISRRASLGGTSLNELSLRSGTTTASSSSNPNIIASYFNGSFSPNSAPAVLEAARKSLTLGSSNNMSSSGNVLLQIGGGFKSQKALRGTATGSSSDDSAVHGSPTLRSGGGRGFPLRGGGEPVGEIDVSTITTADIFTYSSTFATAPAAASLLASTTKSPQPAVDGSKMNEKSAVADALAASQRSEAVTQTQAGSEQHEQQPQQVVSAAKLAMLNALRAHASGSAAGGGAAGANSSNDWGEIQRLKLIEREFEFAIEKLKYDLHNYTRETGAEIQKLKIARQTLSKRLANLNLKQREMKAQVAQRKVSNSVALTRIRETTRRIADQNRMVIRELLKPSDAPDRLSFKSDGSVVGDPLLATHVNNTYYCTRLLNISAADGSKRETKRTGQSCASTSSNMLKPISQSECEGSRGGNLVREGQVYGLSKVALRASEQEERDSEYLQPYLAAHAEALRAYDEEVRKVEFERLSAAQQYSEAKERRDVVEHLREPLRLVVKQHAAALQRYSSEFSFLHQWLSDREVAREALLCCGKQ